jgi:hypothetical protein
MKIIIKIPINYHEKKIRYNSQKKNWMKNQSLLIAFKIKMRKVLKILNLLKKIKKMRFKIK